MYAYNSDFRSLAERLEELESTPHDESFLRFLADSGSCSYIGARVRRGQSHAESPVVYIRQLIPNKLTGCQKRTQTAKDKT